jgi:hypothetical protein
LADSSAFLPIFSAAISHFNYHERQETVRRDWPQFLSVHVKETPFRESNNHIPRQKKKSASINLSSVVTHHTI